MGEAPLYVDLDGNVHRGPVMELVVREMWLTERQSEVVRRYRLGEELTFAERKVLKRAIWRLCQPEAWFRGRGRDPETGVVRGGYQR